MSVAILFGPKILFSLNTILPFPASLKRFRPTTIVERARHMKTRGIQTTGILLSLK